MKKFMALLLCITMFLTLAPTALAADDMTPDKFTFFYADGIKAGECAYLNGVTYINFYDFIAYFASEIDFEYTAGVMNFTYVDRKVKVTVGSNTAYVNGQPVKLSYAARPISDMVDNYSVAAASKRPYLTAPDVCRLLGIKSYGIKYTSSKDLNRLVNGKSVPYIKKGKDYYYYDFTYDKSLNPYKKSQLAFMQGLAAPLFFHNQTKGVTTTSQMNYSKPALKPLTGVSRTSGYRDMYKSLMKTSWGVTTREGLIEQIELCIKSGNGTDKSRIAYDNSRAIMLAQTGYLVGWLRGEETITYGMKAAKRAQKEFSSWEEYSEYYIQAAALYLSSTGYYSAQARKELMDYLYKGDKFLGKTAWNTSLEVDK